MSRFLSVVVVFLVVLPASAADKDTGTDKQPANVAKASGKSKPARAEYDEWIRPYTGKLLSRWFPGRQENVQVSLKLAVTAIEHDEPLANGQSPGFFGQSSHGCQVAADGRVYYFSNGPTGSKGSGYPTIADMDSDRLDRLLAKLPDDGSRLPPPRSPSHFAGARGRSFPCPRL